MHSFYELGDEDFQDILNQVLELKSKFPIVGDKALTVHPIIKAQGLGGEFYQILIQKVLSKIGAKNLSKVTFMQVSAEGHMWIFGGFNVAGDKTSMIVIPKVDVIRQSFTNAAEPFFWFQGGMFPEPRGDKENINLLTTDSRKIAPEHETLIIENVVSAFKFENPTLHNPGTVDCVSCHLAGPAKFWALGQFPWLQIDTKRGEDIYKFGRDLRNISPMQPHTDVLRAFGYFDNRPIVSQRTINESAEIVRYLEANF